MTQSKLESLIEQIVNVLSGLVLSIFIVQPIVFSLYNIHLSHSENLGIAIMFTLVSIARGYVWRRFFNKQLHTKLHLIFKSKRNT